MNTRLRHALLASGLTAALVGSLTVTSSVASAGPMAPAAPLPPMKVQDAEVIRPLPSAIRLTELIVAEEDLGKAATEVAGPLPACGSLGRHSGGVSTTSATRSTMRCVELWVKKHTRCWSEAPTFVMTRFGRVWPATRLRLDTVGGVAGSLLDRHGYTET